MIPGSLKGVLIKNTMFNSNVQNRIPANIGMSNFLPYHQKYNKQN